MPWITVIGSGPSGMQILFELDAWRRCQGQKIGLAKTTGEERLLPSALCWACLGLRPWPLPLETDRYGRVRQGERILMRVFAAGDCAHFDGEGSNTLSAQVAIRKGRHVARNIRRQLKGRFLLPYDYQEQGYFVSMGPADGAGWLGHRSNVLTGLPAFFIREMLETGYDLSIL